MDINNSKMLYGLYGSRINRNNCSGYCYYHKAHLTVKTMKQHQCLSKHCDCLKKHEEHPFWSERERLKELKKANKNKYKM